MGPGLEFEPLLSLSDHLEQHEAHLCANTEHQEDVSQNLDWILVIDILKLPLDDFLPIVRGIKTQ